MSCNFVNLLSRLRKSSAESVENIDSFESFKKYLHIERKVELELKEILRKINASNQKALVMLCGAAGDGKSHLISYLKNSDSENLLSDWEILNDATESSAPNKTSIDTLNEKLTQYNDYNVEYPYGKKTIVAINLGTLSNFIESSAGKNYSKLKDFIYSHGVLSDFTHITRYFDGSIFQYVSFSDYQVFSLDRTGYQTTFLENLFEKIFSRNDNNDFYREYLRNQNCVFAKQCPVRHNFEFLSEKNNQLAVIKKIVDSVLIDKIITSTRDILNLIYDILVHPDFEPDFSSSHKENLHFPQYINFTTPVLLNEYSDISPLLDSINNRDTLKYRNELLDEKIINYQALTNIDVIFKKITSNTSYFLFSEIKGFSSFINKTARKSEVYKFLIRLNDIIDFNQYKENREYIKEYIHYLYLQNSNQEIELSPLYNYTKKAILNWDGDFNGEYINIDNNNDKLFMLQELSLKPKINRGNHVIKGSIDRFYPTIRLYFDKSDGSNEPIELRVDYDLFVLIKKIEEGYRPTVHDRLKHTDFVSFIKKVTMNNIAEQKLKIIPKDPTKNYGVKVYFDGISNVFEIESSKD